MFHVSWLLAAGIFEKSHEKWAEFLVQTSEERVKETVTLNLLGNFRVKNVIASEMPTTKAKGMSPVLKVLC